jgi:hypothetical protein
MNDLHIIIYSYKGKKLLDLIKQIHNTSKDMRYVITLYDQNPVKREKLFNNKNILYKHIFWDHQTSPIIYKKQSINNPKSKYTVILSDDVILSDSWLIDSIKFCKPKTIISGNYHSKYYHKNIFYLGKIKEYKDYYSDTGIIDRDFIFGFSDDLNKEFFPTYLKYNGEEECLSLLYFINNISVYSAPESTYKKYNINALDLYYVPFSKDHNYNLFVSLIKRFENSFVNLIDKKEIIKAFCLKTGIDINYIKFLSYINNDVEYSIHDLNFNKVDGRRFITPIREIS